MMRTVYLEGEMAAKFGEKFEIFAESAKDAVSCLNANFANFKQYLIDCHEKGIGFTCQLAGEYIEGEELMLKYGKGDMILTPVPAGSDGVVKLIAAAVLIFVALPMMAAAAGAIGGTYGSIFMAAATGKLGISGMLVALAGVSLALSGLQDLMAPDPATDNSEAQEESYLYTGTSQNGRIGDPIPIVYGRLRVPGKPIGVNMAGMASRTSDSDSENTDTIMGSTTLTDLATVGSVNLQ